VLTALECGGNQESTRRSVAARQIRRDVSATRDAQTWLPAVLQLQGVIPGDVTFLNSSPNGKETSYIDDQLFMYRIVLAILEALLVASFSCRRLLFSFV
jgi:hypothetical protein